MKTPAILVRCSLSDRVRYNSAATACGLSTAAWCRLVLDAAAAGDSKPGKLESALRVARESFGGGET